MALDLVFLGPPGAGKGTQARMLAECFGLAQLSTGDALRAAVKAETAAGKDAKSLMEAGGLVSDEIVNAIVAQAIDAQNFANGAIFDGYPRNLGQAVALDEMLAKRGRNIACAISFEVDEAALIERISGRFSCGACGEGYHDRFKNPKTKDICDHCGHSNFKRRADDNAKAVATRLVEYHRETAPLIKYYREQNKLQSVDAMNAIDQIAADVFTRVVRVRESHLVEMV